MALGDFLEALRKQEEEDEKRRKMAAAPPLPKEVKEEPDPEKKKGKIREHFKKHWKTYALCAGSFAVGGLLGFGVGALVFKGAAAAVIVEQCGRALKGAKNAVTGGGDGIGHHARLFRGGAARYFRNI